MSSVQDWNPIVFNKSKNSNRGPATSPVRRTNELVRIQKLEDPDIQPIKKIPLTVSAQIQAARAKKGMTQKQLAQLIGVKHDVVQSYENGRAIPNGQLLAKIRRILSIPK